MPALMSYEDRVMIEIVLYGFLSGVVCLFGIGSNIINLVIFSKHGLDTTMNISLFAMALSDLLSLVTLLWTNILVNPLFVNSDIPMYSQEVQYLTGAWPHVCFGHITCWITTYITAERCLCIALPLQVKQIVTPNRTMVSIFIMYILNIASFIPEYASVYIGWRFFPERNRSLLALVVKPNRQEMQGLGFICLAVLGMVSFPAVILFTIILFIKLKQQTTWRKKSASDSKQIQATSKRDIKTMNMVVLIASVLIVCYTPGVLTSLATYFVPGFNIIGDQVNLFCGMWGFAFFFEAVNSSVNVFFYYRMSTKYRNTFNDLFAGCLIQKSYRGGNSNEFSKEEDLQL